MSERVQVTLPDWVAKQLQQWADFEGRPLSNLCAYLLEQTIKQEIKDEAEWTKKPPSDGK
jgi:CopG-like RHH_1 or ribbon-helix-helix domain, RHH_5